MVNFDDAAYAWYAVDFAAALQDVWLASDMSGTWREQRITWFMAGYAALRPLSEGLPEAMPRLLTLLRALKVARLLRAYATTSYDTGPAWLTNMRARHQEWLAAQRAALVWE